MRTPLYSRHCDLKAKIVDFAGWEMPIQYKGILAEHQAVRQAVGLFDVSHMGRIKVSGKEAEPFLDYLSTNRIARKAPHSATYTVWCGSNGGCIDDVIIYRLDEIDFFVIVNAGNRGKDLEHLRQQSKRFDVTVESCFEETGILSLQGPKANDLMSALYAESSNVKPMTFIVIEEHGQPLIISRTGYTGAGGFELYGSNDQIISLWDRLLLEGKRFGIEPIGLGARDTLRLEMGFALYGHELSEEIAPSESVSAWTIKWDKPDFIGKEALVELQSKPSKRSAYGVKLLSPGIARQGYAVLKEGVCIGQVTSGSFTPTLNQAIALILVDAPLSIGERVDIQIRQTICHAEVVQLPFLRKNG